MASEHGSPRNVESMQAELDQLRRQVDEHEVAARARQHRGRGWAVGSLIVLGLILLAVGNLTFWLRGTVLSTNRWVAAVGPLTQNETVANAVSTYVVEGLFDLVQVEQATEDLLPSDYGFLSGPLVLVLEDLAQEAATSLVQSDGFNTVWVGLNRTAHRAVMAVLRGNGDLLYLRSGQLTVDLGDAFKFVADAFNLGDVERLQNVETRFVLLESQQVALVQQALALIDGAGLWIPLLSLVSLLCAWLISLWRRRTVTWIGIGVTIAMLLSLAAIALARPAVLVSISDPFVRLLAGEIWGVVVRGLYIQTILVLVVGLLLIAGAALAGPSPRAVAIRTGARDGWHRLSRRRGEPANPRPE
jgi:tetrahydromethanopterin S-methyltransferase subunit G